MENHRHASCVTKGTCEQVSVTVALAETSKESLSSVCVLSLYDFEDFNQITLIALAKNIML